MTLSQKLGVPFEPEGEPSYSVVRALDEIFASAAGARATDVHLEPFAPGGRVRERVDGVLRESRRLEGDVFDRVASRLKLLAGMDITDRRLPQEGRYCTRARGRSIEARISSMPTVCGERIAIRLLQPQSQIPNLEELGMPAAMAERYRKALHAPSGFVIVCGPTGSGKTTTLYASVAERNVAGQHVCSVEDPVEILLPGVAQLQVNARAGLTFTSALRAFLRQDPDVVMIGEMRDADTASVASAAALCGQLVLTTLHANDALAAVDRLCELGLRPRTVAACVTAIVSQRLVRELCVNCKGPGEKGVACERCSGSGFWGRSALFEMAVMTAELRRAIETGAPHGERLEIARRDGYEPMELAARRSVAEGRTTPSETDRVLGRIRW